MRINAKEMIAGYPAMKVRGLLRRGSSGLCAQMVLDALKVDDAAAAELLAALEADGTIEKSKNDEGWWRPTVKGNSLIMASASAPMQRKAANKLLVDFLKRVEQVRDDPKYVNKVTSVVLFGSFLSDAPTLGDIDLAILFRRAYADPDVQEQAEKKCRQDAEDSGRNFPDFIARLFWPENEVRMFLKSRRKFSIHDPRSDGPIIEAGPHVTIYEDEKVVRGSIPLLEDWP